MRITYLGLIQAKSIRLNFTLIGTLSGILKGMKFAQNETKTFETRHLTEQMILLTEYFLLTSRVSRDGSRWGDGGMPWADPGGGGPRGHGPPQSANIIKGFGPHIDD